MANVQPFDQGEVEPEINDIQVDDSHQEADQPHDAEPIQEEARKPRRRATLPRLQYNLHSGWLADLDCSKLILKQKVPLTCRSLSYPLDDSTLYKCAIGHQDLKRKDCKLSSHPLDDSILYKHAIREMQALQENRNGIDDEFKIKEIIDEMRKKRKETFKHQQKLLHQLILEQNYRKFYLTANQLFLYGQVTTVCALCTCKKKNNDYPESHIFPEGLLRLYRTIHCEDIENFIYNSSRPPRQEVTGANTLALPLFCSECEQKACAEEKFLCHLYCKVMGIEAEKHLRITKDQSHELQHVLAVLLFRGMLVGINFREARLEDYCEDFLECFFQLRDYCLESNMETYREMAIAKRIHLYLMPNSPLDIRIASPAYILDFQLRNPEFTTVFHPFLKEPCLYMKFDCFHCVIPLTGDGNIELPGRHAKLGSCLSQDFDNDDGHFTFPNHKEAKQLFPAALLKYNISQVDSLLHQFLHIPKWITSQPYCIVKLPVMMQLCAPKETKYPSQVRGEEVDFEQDGPEEALLEEAKRASPLEAVAVEFKTLLKTNVQPYRNSQTQIEDYHFFKENERLQKENERLQKENERLQKENKRLQKEIKAISKKNKELEKLFMSPIEATS